MKKLNFKIDGLAKKLTKNQMKKINGGYSACYYWVNEECTTDIFGYAVGQNVVWCQVDESIEDCTSFYEFICDNDECCDNLQC